MIIEEGDLEVFGYLLEMGVERVGIVIVNVLVFEFSN